MRARPGCACDDRRNLAVSTREPVRARPVAQRERPHLVRGFNPRAREGSTLSPLLAERPMTVSTREPVRARREHVGWHVPACQVSTREPVRARRGGAARTRNRRRVSTREPVRARPCAATSQPTARVSTREPVRARRRRRLSGLRQQCFNPRAREGSTWTGNRPCRHQRGFNPRAREGSTEAPDLAIDHAIVSTREPVRARHFFS